jgi:hypothetical protein
MNAAAKKLQRYKAELIAIARAASKARSASRARASAPTQRD